MKWITRERPKIDRIACPWLIARFIDKDPDFLFVPAEQVKAQAELSGAIAYDVPGVEFTHVGNRCSFDAFVAKYKLSTPAIDRLANIVRGADTDKLGLTPQSAGLLAISLGLSRNFRDDSTLLQQGLIIYDALFAWCSECQDERHNWPAPEVNSMYWSWVQAQ